MSVDINIRNSPDKKMDIDFSDCRRHSFLPSDWIEEKQDHIKNVKVLEFQEDDDLYMYMDTPSHYTEKPLQTFCTGSKYLGQWNKLGISGKGVYRYPHGTIYDGYFNRNGEFHGSGILVYPSGQRIEGIWKNGKLQSDCTFVTRGGVVMNKHYCKMPDRRFQIEVENDFNPVGQEYLTNEIPPARKIPEGCYDVGEGMYDPRIKSVLSYKSAKTGKPNNNSLIDLNLFADDNRRQSYFSSVILSPRSDEFLTRLLQRQMYTEIKFVLWIPNTEQEYWIVKNARKAWDEPTKYRADLYEEWTKGGSASETVRLEKVSSDTDIEMEMFASINIYKPSKTMTPRLQPFTRQYLVEDEILLTEIMVHKLIQNDSTFFIRLDMDVAEHKNNKHTQPPENRLN